MEKKKLTAFDPGRRSFLGLSGLACLGTVAAALPLVKSESTVFSGKEYKVSATRLAMGTFVTMTAIHHSRNEAENVIGLAFEEITRLEGRLSRFEKNSALSELNDRGNIEAKASPDLYDLVARSVYYSHITGGAFDITVKPLIDLFEKRFAAGKEPSRLEIGKAVGGTGMERIRFDNGNILLNGQNMGITLDGIAKGYIVDCASRLLSQKGIHNHLIDAGGDIRTSGAASGDRPWTVALQDPDDKNGYRSVVEMRCGAIATSGNYEVYYDEEKMFHHIVDGSTGYSPRQFTSVTVKADTVMEADALSTSVFIMSPDDGIGLINRLPNCECYCIAGNDTNLKSAGWKIVG